MRERERDEVYNSEREMKYIIELERWENWVLNTREMKYIIELERWENWVSNTRRSACSANNLPLR